MGHNRSNLCVRHANRRGMLPGLCQAIGLSLLMVRAAWSQEVVSPDTALEEPKALPSPVKLIPVEEAPILPPQSDVAPASAPPVRLAPEPSPLGSSKSKQITQTVQGIRPASFKDLIPGESTRQDVLDKLGEPQQTTSSDADEKLEFALGPFPKVQITLVDQVVTSIVIHLATPTARDEVVKELKLEEFEPVVIRDKSARQLGEVYPERALMFGYTQTTPEGEEPQVEQVVLERISVEPFLLRAEQMPDEQITKRLTDLRIVQRLLPDDGEAFALAARLDERCGRVQAALQAAQKSVELDSSQAQYRITLADLQRQAGQQQAAADTLLSTLRDTKLTELEQAEARFLYGRVLAATPNFDYKQALQETVTSIKLAAAPTKQGNKETRMRARQLLIRAELSLAEIISYGPWKQKHEVVPQWLASAEKTANEYIEQGGSRAVLLSVYRTSLHCLLILEGQGSPEKIADAAIQLGRELIAESEDEAFQALVEWRLGTGLWYAALILQGQGHSDQSLQLANNSEALLSAAKSVRDDAPETTHHLAQLHFLMGSIHAIQKRDHATATTWYDKAMPQLADSYPDSLIDERGMLGERLVSVGISLWETGRKNQAVSVTEEGTAMILNAVEDGTYKRVALAIPYQNLAEMYRGLGKNKEADLMAKKAAQYESPDKGRTKAR